MREDSESRRRSKGKNTKSELRFRQCFDESIITFYPDLVFFISAILESRIMHLKTYMLDYFNSRHLENETTEILKITNESFRFPFFKHSLSIFLSDILFEQDINSCSKLLKKSLRFKTSILSSTSAISFYLTCTIFSNLIHGEGKNFPCAINIREP